MHAVAFPQSNCNFGPPPSLTESQCRTIPAYTGIVERGSLESTKLVVVAHQPTEADRIRIAEGGPIFLTTFGGLPPHFLTTRFEEAVNVA